MGQIMWPAIDVNETAGYGKPIEECRMRPVMLQAIDEDDIQMLIDGAKRSEVRRQAAVRMCKQAHEQDGVLTLADVGSILNVSPPTISRYLKDYEKEHPGELVPRRGTIHDMGPTITHKAVICRKVIVEGMSVEQTARTTRHSPAAVTRYVKDYRRVATCLNQGMNIRQTSYATKLPQKLVEEYHELIIINQPIQTGQNQKEVR